MRLIKILLVLLLIISAQACVMTTSSQPTMPTKPTIEIKKQDNGGICIDKQSTKDLLLYIYQLEQEIKNE